MFVFWIYLHRVLMSDYRLHRKSNELPVGNELKQINDLDMARDMGDTIIWRKFTLEVTSNPVTKQPDLFSYRLSCDAKYNKKIHRCLNKWKKWVIKRMSLLVTKLKGKSFSSSSSLSTGISTFNSSKSILERKLVPSLRYEIPQRVYCHRIARTTTLWQNIRICIEILYRLRQ